MTDDEPTPQGALFRWFYEDIADSEDATTLAHDAIVALSAAGFEVLPSALLDALRDAYASEYDDAVWSAIDAINLWRVTP